jgi:hypothetical protein
MRQASSRSPTKEHLRSRQNLNSLDNPWIVADYLAFPQEFLIHGESMPRKPKPQPDNPEQFKRFIETARDVEADESPDAVDRAFKRVVRPTKDQKGE